MNEAQIQQFMDKARQARREAVRSSIVRGRCVKCGWVGPKGLTAQLEYELHLYDHQTAAYLVEVQVTWGPP